MSRVTVKPMQTLDAIVRAIATDEIDAAIMPALVCAICWPRTRPSSSDGIRNLTKFSSAPCSRPAGGVAAQAPEFQAYSRHWVARSGDDHCPVCLSRPWNQRRGCSEASAYFIDPQAQLDVADIDRQIAWHKAQGRVDKTVSARDVVDPSFVK